MQKRSRLGKALLFQNGEAVVVSLAHMQRDGQSRFLGQANLSAEDLALHIARRQVVVVVEPDLPHRAHAAVAQTLAQGGLKLRRPLLGVVRVHAGRDAHVGHRRSGDKCRPCHHPLLP